MCLEENEYWSKLFYLFIHFPATFSLHKAVQESFFQNVSQFCWWTYRLGAGVGRREAEENSQLFDAEAKNRNALNLIITLTLNFCLNVAFQRMFSPLWRKIWRCVVARKSHIAVIVTNTETPHTQIILIENKARCQHSESTRLFGRLWQTQCCQLHVTKALRCRTIQNVRLFF